MRVRFAPSPTGNLHIGGLRTALFNYLIARKAGGSFILRIEDTDRKRYQPGAVDTLIRSLKWSGIQYDEGPGIPGSFGPYIQSERLNLYRSAIDQLLEAGQAYRDYSQPGEPVKLLNGRDQDLYKTHVVRLKIPEKDTTFKDTVYGEITIPAPRPPGMGYTNDPILLKSDGFPTYHLANVVDDSHMQISHVLRGEEWLSSMPTHLAIYKALEKPTPEFAHLPLLVNPDGTKLSKRSGDVSVEDYITKGWEPEAFVNYTALMGWNALKTSNSSNPSEYMTMEDLIRRFDLNDVPHKRASMFGGKLQFLNKQHLGRKVEKGDAELIDRFRTLLEKHLFVDGFQYDNEYLGEVLLLIRDRISNLNEAVLMGDYFFIEPDYMSDDAKNAYGSTSVEKIDIVLKSVYEILKNEEDWQVATLNSHLKQQQKSLGLKTNEFMMPLRWALTGKKMGPSVGSTMHLLGKATTVNRLLNRI
ncbi:glutamyl-tRNA synthetase [Wallemia mellicola CBS 633.66]|uniref:glutamate--tRNA ligase n=1 Tax=Wallemia mellicola (strain ATCC MYA-4683 / CBS 633.66) TaxID=671144 RepID=I4YAT4_WALMC|nr:glutamyl-tRNA synthetase [Wallemia mellicola CBS 633.66]EIM21076.1 glutamyl-tRNA synthetase [Wallemia mellicola CBS 633.66]|eukprot:XP_006958760.1 glutamyl-tRNA synthetase [Wallemia mellicola CBS 633.66]